MTKENLLHAFELHGESFELNWVREFGGVVLTEAKSGDTVLRFVVRGSISYVNNESGTIGWIEDTCTGFVYVERPHSTYFYTGVTDLQEAEVFVSIRYLNHMHDLHVRGCDSAPKEADTPLPPIARCPQPGVALFDTTLFMNDTKTTADPVETPCLLSFDGATFDDSVTLNIGVGSMELSVALSRRDLMQMVTDSIAPQR